MLLLPSPVFSLSTCFVTCMGVLSAFMFLCTVPEEVKGYQIPGTRVTAFKIPCACWGLNVGLLEERPGFSTTEASLHPQKPHFNLAFWLCLHSHNDFLLNKQSTPDTVMNTFSTPGTTIGWSYWYMCILDNLIRALFIHSMNSLMSAWTHTMFPSFLCIKVKDPISRGSGRPSFVRSCTKYVKCWTIPNPWKRKKGSFSDGQLWSMCIMLHICFYDIETIVNIIPYI